jgi:KUP system potassium uptake protein
VPGAGPAGGSDADLVLLGRETLIPTPSPPLGPVEARVFTWLSSGNLTATAYFKIPPERVVELGTQIEV